jgi:periplasmic copper chaperone A
MRNIFALLLCLVQFAAPAWATDITVSRAILVASPNPNATTLAAYFTIENNGSALETLTGITTEAAASTMLHETTNVDGIMKMQMLDRFDILPGATLDMKPAKIHVMLVGPKRPLRVGSDVVFDLIFAPGGKIQVVAKIVPLSQLLLN